ncbi:MAG: hypothetical protein WAO74_13430 [Polaribacter sp.]|uniref:hypothetical protein n=1 Tax=Polaribacter sp. TaxID=1920175 RepID=UPI003BB00F1A
MRKIINFRNVLLLTLAFTFSFCSGDDSDSGQFPGVPSGEIVALELRQETLTGYSAKGVDAQKWWTHVVSNIDISGPEDCGEGQSIRNVGYFAFSPNGDLIFRTSKNGSTTTRGTWRWGNDNKNTVYASDIGNVEFTLTYLNANNLVIASQQAAGPCSATTYEQFNDPFVD